MNFLIFRNFSRIFLIFYEFIWIYFELKRIKIIFISRGNVAAEVARTNDRSNQCDRQLHMVSCQNKLQTYQFNENNLT